MNRKIRNGTASEYLVMGMLLNSGIDVYKTVADDQGIDAVLRVVGDDGGTRYFDVQIKSAKNWGDIRCKTEFIKSGENSILILFNSNEHECLWFVGGDIERNFPRTGFEFGDIFLRNPQRDALLEDGMGRDDLGKLHGVLKAVAD